MKKLGLYGWSVILCFLVVPIAAINTEFFIIQSDIPLSEIVLKWVAFSGVGLRLGGAGIKQIVQPAFTAKEIFKIQDNGAFPLVRELGFANICFAAIALISFFVPSFRLPAAVGGGLYFGLAGVQHLIKPRGSSEETFAMLSDFFIFIVLSVCVFINLT